MLVQIGTIKTIISVQHNLSDRAWTTAVGRRYGVAARVIRMGRRLREAVGYALKRLLRLPMSPGGLARLVGDRLGSITNK
jgi:hypothetical protein